VTAVQLYPLDHPALVLSVRRKLEVEREQAILNLGLGNISSFEDYKYRVGLIEGLRIALMLVEETEKQFK
jgi:hypothetical protein